jgi:hypothetical protein
MKICQVGAELFHAEGGQTDEQTEMTMLINAIRHFANAPNSNNNTNNNNNNTLELRKRTVCGSVYWIHVDQIRYRLQPWISVF